MDKATKSSSNSLPFHVLMEDENASSRMYIERHMKRDYLSRRRRAFQVAPPCPLSGAVAGNLGAPPCGGIDSNNGKPRPQLDSENSLWSGVSQVERMLVACCIVVQPDNVASSSTTTNDTDDEKYIIGALRRDKIAVFVSTLAFHCHDLNSRSLALSILERSQDADDKEMDIFMDHALSDDTAITAESTSNKKLKVSTESNGENVKLLQEQQQQKDQSQSRVMLFLAAGGLKILSRWLVEATTPILVPPPKAPPGARPQRRLPEPKLAPSVTGPLLLALLVFLVKIPFDKQLITQSKINKEIRKLSKKVDPLVSSSASQSNATDPLTGGLYITDVQKAMNNLKRSWDDRAKKSGKLMPTVVNPFASVQGLLKERLDAINKWEEGKGDQPEWMVKAQSVKRAKEKAKPRKQQSTQQLALKERQNEREHIMKENLLKAQQERYELLRRLRDMQKQKVAESERAHRSLETRTKNRVHWKDKFGSSSSSRNRILLEEVFLFVREDVPNVISGKPDDETETVDPSSEPETMDNEILFENS